MIKILSYLIAISSFVLSINNNVNDIAHYLDKKNLSISGEFYSYDFPQVSSHWDYVFKSADGTILQLRGNPTTPSDLFGWKPLDLKIYKVPDYYFIYLGDFDFDGDSRFDWILIQQSKQLAYKLKGITSSSTFNWSQQIPVTFYINNTQVVFTKNATLNPTPIQTPTTPAVTQPPINPPQATPVDSLLPKIPIPSTNLEKPPIPPSS